MSILAKGLWFVILEDSGSLQMAQMTSSLICCINLNSCRLRNRISFCTQFCYFSAGGLFSAIMTNSSMSFVLRIPNTWFPWLFENFLVDVPHVISRVQINKWSIQSLIISSICPARRASRRASSVPSYVFDFFASAVATKAWTLFIYLDLGLNVGDM